MRRVAIYIRVSTQAQAQEGDSIPAQREALTEYIHSHQDLVLAGEYMDDGVSGQKYEQRDELQRMLADVKAGKIDLIICTKMDRLHRSLRHFLDMQEVLDKYKVPWVAIWEPMYDTTTPTGQLIVTQMMSFAQFEAQNTGSRIRQVIDYKISQGQVVSGKVPCGYRIEGKRLVPNDVAPSVVEAFEYYARVGCLHETMRHCASLPGLPMLATSFRKMLTNRKYIGEHRGNAEYCPPLVSKDLFEAVQRQLATNIRITRKRTYLFSGICKCGECGYRLDVSPRKNITKSGPVDFAYYRCSKHYRVPHTCANTMTINEDRIEAYLVEHLRGEISAYVFECQQQAAPQRDNARRIADLQRKVDRLKDLYINELISLDEYRSDKARYMADIEALSIQAPEEPVDTSALEELLSKDISAYYYGLSRDERSFFWRSIIKRITIDSHKHIEITFL